MIDSIKTVNTIYILQYKSLVIAQCMVIPNEKGTISIRNYSLIFSRVENVYSRNSRYLVGKYNEYLSIVYSKVEYRVTAK